MPRAIDITFEGRTQSITAWAREYGISYRTLYERLKRGWEIGQALTAPPDERRRPTDLLVSYQGRTQTILAWSRELGISCATLRNRLDVWSVERAFTAPTRG